MRTILLMIGSAFCGALIFAAGLYGYFYYQFSKATSGDGGGQAPNADASRDLLMALDRWVEEGAAPDSIVASRVVSGVVARTHPLCAYPKKAVYKGSGSIDDAASFSCQ